MRHLLLIAAAATAVVGCAPTAGPDGVVGASSARQCFRPDMVRNFRSSDFQTIYIRSHNEGVFELKASGFCRELDFAQTLAISSSMGGSRLCAGDWADIRVAALGSDTQRCRALVTRRLTEAEVEALPSRDRP